MTCPVFTSNRFLARLVDVADTKELLEVYSNENALPFFNSDNCDGDIFFYETEEIMRKAIEYETNESIYEILDVIVPVVAREFQCDVIVTKAAPYAIERDHLSIESWKSNSC